MASSKTASPGSAVVIGAGIAGLAASIRLSVLGFHVTLLERHDHLGGKIRTTPSAAGPVDAGPTVLTMRHVFDDLFQTAGTRLSDHVELVRQDVLARHFWSDGSHLDLFADPERSADAVGAFAGARSKREFEAFCAKTKQLFEAFDAPMMQEPQPKLGKLIGHVLPRPKLALSMSPMATLTTLLKKQFSDPRLRQLFGRYATYVGGAPQLSPAVLALIWQAEAAGVWVVKGGMHRLAEALANVARMNGVAIETGCHVDQVEVAKNSVRSVKLQDGRSMPADIVVAAGDPRALATGALGPDVEHLAPATKSVARSFSARVHSFCATVRGPELAHHNVFFADEGDSEFADLAAGGIPRNPTLYLCAEDRGMGDRLTGPERFEMIANAPATDTPTDYEELDAWHRLIMKRMTEFGTSFAPMPTTQTITTPQTFAEMFPASLGALYGQSPHGLMAAFKRPTARTPVQGLYLCGGGTHPGAGVPMATLSARHVAEAIWNDRISTSTSAQTAMHGGMSTA